MSKTPWGETRGAVLAYLIHEADMDGLVTVAEREIGEALGITGRAVGHHIANLAADGLLTVEVAAAGFASMNAIQLAESVYA